MHFPSDLAAWLNAIGAVSVGAGSILLAWRVKEILKWVVYCLVAHEQSIEQLSNLAAGPRASLDCPNTVLYRGKVRVIQAPGSTGPDRVQIDISHA